jgi:predicted RNA-binding protein YlxR (DUF448 family)
VRHRGPIRSCVGCRRRHPAHALLRLQVDDAGRLSPVLGAGDGGRSAWVCPSRACVKRIQRNPRGLHRALKRKPAPEVVGLRERLLVHIDEEVARLLSRCRRDGVVVSGRARLLAAGELVALVVASDSSAESQRQVRKVHSAAVCAQIGLDRAGLGGLVGKKDRSILGIQGGRSGELLVLCLQQRVNLS